MARRLTQEQEAELTPEQESVLRHMADGRTSIEAATESGVSVAEVGQWLNTSAVFVAGLNAQRLDRHQANEQRLRQLAGQAIDTLETLLNSDNETVRLKAATAALKAVSVAEVPSDRFVRAGAVAKYWQNDRMFERF